jgi:hypothetical protein
MRRLTPFYQLRTTDEPVCGTRSLASIEYSR